ncbi:AAA family ATPase [Candidatus Nitrosotenuis cloacae]|uniref:Replication protein C n=1 Tax=Candidatus Nitrosotenuis cloacae TaxID=1603555 RepID=A0A3G1B4N7_9ARCH|nr:AAA family ATPase [Candidatus Nitrosotenuis cloacae]AJZ76723.1 replication protein C [Candidatus Nitrosotenuis cloacae]
MWSEKHRPKQIIDMVGNEEARKSFVDWIIKWKKGAKPILLVGPPGIGKTTLAQLAAKEFGYDVIGMNASDVRNKSNIEELLSPLLGSTSLLGRPMIFIDEVDGIHGRSDFGGVEALLKILKEPTVPIILAANSDDSDKMKNIKKTAKTIYLKPVPPRLLGLYLGKVLKEEGAKLSPGTTIKVIVECRGDIRSMLNMAQAQMGGFDVDSEKSFEALDIEAGINAFFKAKTRQEAQSVLYSLRIDPREKLNAFYSSIVTSNIQNKDMARLLDVISEADVLYGRIIRTQEWRLLRYLDNILLRLYSENLPIQYSQYNLSWPLLNKLRWDGKVIKSLAANLAQRFHVSQSTTATYYLPYILFCMKNKKLELEINPEYSEVLQKEIELIH